MLMNRSIHSHIEIQVRHRRIGFLPGFVCLSQRRHAGLLSCIEQNVMTETGWFEWNAKRSVIYSMIAYLSNRFTSSCFKCTIYSCMHTYYICIPTHALSQLHMYADTRMFANC